MKLIFATHNQHKLEEVQQLLPKSIQLLSLTDINCSEDIPETATTLEGNAKLKADYITKNYGYDCFADDTGLEVEALQGEPGVYSARYAGVENNAEANMHKLLTNLKNKTNRNAQFKTVITLNLKENQYLFEGVCKGEILHKRQGEQGFGYDPVFKPEGFDISFAEMTLAEKSSISHRGKAVEKLVKFLKVALLNN
jgi:XTP/dITP diphosphohydrolase